jgi:CubicO group peptidase (beta-lactamase class C family)
MSTPPFKFESVKSESKNRWVTFSNFQTGTLAVKVSRASQLNASKTLWLPVALLGLTQPVTRCASAEISADETNGIRVDALVREVMTREHIPGLALAVVRDGKIFKEAGYGLADIESKAPVTPDTIFRIASVSKQFVATAVMMLVEEGKLKVEDPISRYLEGTPASWSGITIRHLLTHTSGIPDFINEDIPVNPSHNGFDERVLRAVADRPLHFTPGDEWRYSNSNYHLLGMIIRKVTGLAYGDFLRERIFKPLGMTNTAVSSRKGKVEGLATGYELNDNRLRPGDYVAASVKSYAGGGLVSTVRDMAKWDAALYRDTLVKQATLKEMWTPVRLNDGSFKRYGYGWGTVRMNGRLIVSHDGNFTGFSSTIYRAVDDRLTVIILDNRFSSQTALSQLAQKITRIYLWKGPEYQPIPDKEPEVSTRLKDVLDRGDRGQSNPQDFTPKVWAELSPWQRQSREDGANYGLATSFVLVDRAGEGGAPSFRYRIKYKFGAILLHAVLDAQNKIAVWETEDVELN